MITSGEHEVGGELVLGEDRERRVGVGRALDRIAEVLEQLGGELADIVVVLHHEDAIAAADRGLLGAGGGRDLGVDRAHRLRQIDGEGRAVSERAGDLDVAVGLLDEAERLAQAEAGSLADLLGREERLEDRVEIFRRDAGAGILDRDRDEVAAARGLRAQGRDVLAPS